MIVVCDMGPLHYLVLMEVEHVLPQLFTRVLTPPVVLVEMSRPEAPEPVRRWAGSPPQWLEVKQPVHVEDIPALGRKGSRGDGDRAVISIAREEGADFVVMDDMRARREAKKRGCEPLWMLQSLDEAAERGLIDDVSQRLEHLQTHPQRLPYGNRDLELDKHAWFRPQRVCRTHDPRRYPQPRSMSLAGRLLSLTPPLADDRLDEPRGGKTMATERANDLYAFRSFIDEQLTGETVPTVDEVLARWAYENQSDEEREETLEAIGRGFADVEAGRVMPAREAVAELRRKHKLPELS
jgi:predicted nucleic acid-binding protein/predicted transcriptional regulator